MLCVVRQVVCGMCDRNGADWWSAANCIAKKISFSFCASLKWHFNRHFDRTRSVKCGNWCTCSTFPHTNQSAVKVCSWWCQRHKIEKCHHRRWLVGADNAHNHCIFGLEVHYIRLNRVHRLRWSEFSTSRSADRIREEKGNRKTFHGKMIALVCSNNHHHRRCRCYTRQRIFVQCGIADHIRMCNAWMHFAIKFSTHTLTVKLCGGKTLTFS